MKISTHARQRLASALVLCTLPVLLVLLGCGDPQQPDIPFAPMTDDSIEDPDNPIKVFRVDMAKVEYDVPLSRADLMKLTPENLQTFSQEEIDQIYGRLTAGPIPDGPHRGDLFFSRGDSMDVRLGEIVGGVGGRITGAKVRALEKLGRALWKGKMFYRDEGVLRNFIDDLSALGVIVEDEASVPTMTVPRGGLLGAVLPDTTVWLLFPAKLYCGQSLVDGRRESVIIDYAYSDEIDGYRASPDSLGGRGGLKIRDELRMIRPGFYLGRAYSSRAFLVNFTMYNAEVAEQNAASFAQGAAIDEDCWVGEQVRRTAMK